MALTLNCLPPGRRGRGRSALPIPAPAHVRRPPSRRNGDIGPRRRSQPVDDDPIDATDPYGLGPLDRNCTLKYQFGSTRSAAVPCWFDPAGHLIYDVSGLQCFDTALFSQDPGLYRVAAAGCAVISVTGGPAVARIGWRLIARLPGFGVAARVGGRYIGGAFAVGRDFAANALGAAGRKIGSWVPSWVADRLPWIAHGNSAATQNSVLSRAMSKWLSGSPDDRRSPR